MKRPVVAVLAGGASVRMGRDKAELPFGDATMLECVCRSALGAGADVLVVGRERPEGWSLDGPTFAEDDEPGAGPLGGIATALRRTGGTVIVLACDMPLVTSEAIVWLIEETRRKDAVDGVAVTAGERLEPLFSAYAPTLLDEIERRLTAGELSLRPLLAGRSFRRAEAPAWIAALLRNVNTPGEYGRAAEVKSQK